VNSYIDNLEPGIQVRLTLAWFYDGTFPGTLARGNFLLGAFAAFVALVLLCLWLAWRTQLDHATNIGTSDLLHGGNKTSARVENPKEKLHLLTYQMLVGKLSREYMTLSKGAANKDDATPAVEEDEENGRFKKLSKESSSSETLKSRKGSVKDGKKKVKATEKK